MKFQQNQLLNQNLQRTTNFLGYRGQFPGSIHVATNIPEFLVYSFSTIIGLVVENASRGSLSQ